MNYKMNLTLMALAMAALLAGGCRHDAQRTGGAAPGAVVSGDVMTFPNSKGAVSFDHKKHQDLLKDCSKCHDKGAGKIEGFGKDWAHSRCKGCHAEMKQGPTGCNDCHKK